MKRFSIRSWQQDRILKRVLRHSSYLFASYVLGAVLTFASAKLLGVASFGVLGTITVFVSSINRLFSFRMGETVIKYMGEALAHQDMTRASAAVKAAMLMEAATSLLAFCTLLLVAPLGAAYFAHDPAATPLFMIYGLAILANVINESSTGVLQVTNHYRTLALINFAQTVVAAVLMGLAALFHAGLFEVLMIYLLGKLVLGMGPAVLALYWLPRALGPAWWRAPLSVLRPWREMARFAVSTNLSGTVTMVARDNEVPIVSFFFGSAAAGYYKIAQAIISIIGQVITPLTNTTYPEITRAIASGQWPDLRRLLRRVSLIAAGWTGAVALGLFVVGRPVLFGEWTLFGRTFSLLGEYAPAYPLVMILLAGYGTANIFFWNRPLLLAQGKADYALKVGFWAALVKLVLMVILLPRTSYLVEGALLSGYLLVTVLLSVRAGLAGITRGQSKSGPVLRPGEEAA